MPVVGVARWMSKLLSSRSGNFAIMSALLLPVGVGVAAFAVDEGSLYFERREAQAITDLAAITAAANIGRAEAVVLTTFDDNRHTDVVLVREVGPMMVTVKKDVRVERGRYVADPAVAPEVRFVTGGEPANAVKVTFRRKGSRYFASRLFPTPTISTVAIASLPAEAAFSVGSRLLSLNGGILNSVLGDLLGSSISLSVMDYNALIDTDVSVLGFLKALATEIRITGGTYDDVLASEVSLGQLAKALATVSGHNRQAQLAVSSLAASASGSERIPLSHLFSLGSFGRLDVGGGNAGFDAALGMMEIIGASAAIANGQNQVRLNSGVAVPGLLGATVELAVGEPPQNSTWFAIGESGTVVRTAQTRLKVIASIGGPGGLLGASIKLPIYIELAYAEATLQGIACPTGRPESARVSISAKPGVAEIWIGEINADEMKTFSRKPTVKPAKLVQMPIVTATGSAHVEVGNVHPIALTFTKREIDDRVVKSVSSRSLTQSLTRSLIKDLELKVSLNLGPLTLGVLVPSSDAVKSSLTDILEEASSPVDTLVYNLLSAIGVKVGEADIRVNGVSCGRSVLVN